jgi:hypothetical protein
MVFFQTELSAEQVYASMPRKQKQAPTQFLSDPETDGEEQKSSPPPRASVVDVEDTPAVPKQQPGRLSRVYTLEESDGDNTDVNLKPRRKRPTPTDKPKAEGANIAELVAILTQSNASLKGKIDDTGRFELEFELNRQAEGMVYDHPGSYGGPLSPASSIESGSPPLKQGIHRGPKPDKRLLWIAGSR